MTKKHELPITLRVSEISNFKTRNVEINRFFYTSQYEFGPEDITGYGYFTDKYRITDIVCEKDKDTINVWLISFRPGIIIGEGGRNIDKLERELSEMFKEKFKIHIQENRIWNLV